MKLWMFLLLSLLLLEIQNGESAQYFIMCSFSFLTEAAVTAVKENVDVWLL